MEDEKSVLLDYLNENAERVNNSGEHLRSLLACAVKEGKLEDVDREALIFAYKNFVEYVALLKYFNKRGSVA